MTKSLSVYLNLLRVVFAFAVLLGHSSDSLFPAAKKIGVHSGEAVAGFFVLSGFVIAFVLKTKEKDYKIYFESRLTRMYSVVPISIIVCIVVSQLRLYYISKTGITYPLNEINTQIDAYSILRIISFTNEIWFSHVANPEIEPFWSLGFEFVYYICFYCCIHFRGWKRIIVLMLCCLIFGPKLTLYFSLWLLGVLTLNIIEKLNKSDGKKNNNIGNLGIIVSIVLYIIVKFTYAKGTGSIYNFQYDSISARTYLYYMAVGAVVSMNIISFNMAEIKYISERKMISNTIIWLSGFSFTLYLCHLPLVRFWAEILKGMDSAFIRILCLVVTVVLCAVVAEFGERRKLLYKRIIHRLFQYT